MPSWKHRKLDFWPPTILSWFINNFSSWIHHLGSNPSQLHFGMFLLVVQNSYYARIVMPFEYFQSKKYQISSTLSKNNWKNKHIENEEKSSKTEHFNFGQVLIRFLVAQMHTQSYHDLQNLSIVSAYCITRSSWNRKIHLEYV